MKISSREGRTECLKWLTWALILWKHMSRLQDADTPWAWAVTSSRIDRPQSRQCSNHGWLRAVGQSPSKTADRWTDLHERYSLAWLGSGFVVLFFRQPKLIIVTVQSSISSCSFFMHYWRELGASVWKRKPGETQTIVFMNLFLIHHWLLVLNGVSLLGYRHQSMVLFKNKRATFCWVLIKH